MASSAAREKRQLMEAAVESASQAQAHAAVAALEAKVRMQEDMARIEQQQAKEAADLEAAQKELARFAGGRTAGGRGDAGAQAHDGAQG